MTSSSPPALTPGAVPPQRGVHHDIENIRQIIAATDAPCFVVRTPRGLGACAALPSESPVDVLAYCPPTPPERLGSAEFPRRHGVRQPYMAGAMGGGVASVPLVVALARAGFLASYGAAGVDPARVDEAVGRLRRELPGGSFAVNLHDDARRPDQVETLVELFLRRGVRCVEASAFAQLAPALVRYRAAGLRRDPQGRVLAEHRVVAKVVGVEAAERFLAPAPGPLLGALVARGQLTPEQAELAARVPMADDVTVEVDGAGDACPWAVALPTVLAARDRAQARYGYPEPVGVGVAGGIGTPVAAAAAFHLGVDYVVTGSVNQSCVEAATSDAVKRLLARAGVGSCELAPCATGFEDGAVVPVLRDGTRYSARARRLRQVFLAHEAIHEIAPTERRWLEAQVFGCGLDQAWRRVRDQLGQQDPAALDRAERDPKQTMALLFRWHLARTAGWAVDGDPTHEQDYQIRCGAAMGAFNDWVRGTVLEPLPNRRVAEVARHVMRGAAFHARVAQLRLAGLRLPEVCATYRLSPPARPQDRPATAARNGRTYG
ncbi:PfaD family polyunsaturated fatty acid/polyketide biosynthesis protein [Streptoalloteichus hindustanus]|uniref:PfaD family protein n=1 Tax=Streptoalloteichus hindustanus TaxID=2017 RepID=A0A1M5PRX4_STRHI|nr:PfaD family polyunsaturated fatty acid/polyketide biosynthesis protein [Streptoalloteichus hindustanus]SHH04279.1 PfaD family protein [Streptoalloteichus hindustanus]